MEEQNKYEYSYDAAQQAELRALREKYTVKGSNKLETLRRLDNQVTVKAKITALTLGILGTLIAGTGMSLCLVGELFAVGIPVGILGLFSVSMAYPAYNRSIKSGRARIAPEILRMTDELLN